MESQKGAYMVIKAVQKVGLSYSELVKLKKLWNLANQLQKEKILESKTKKSDNGIPTVVTWSNNKE